MLEGLIYKGGTRIRISGVYVCVPCGYRRRFNKGEIFPRCIKCMDKKQFQDEELDSNPGIWELTRKI